MIGAGRSRDRSGKGNQIMRSPRCGRLGGMTIAATAILGPWGLGNAWGQAIEPVPSAVERWEAEMEPVGHAEIGPPILPHSSPQYGPPTPEGVGTYRPGAPPMGASNLEGGLYPFPVNGGAGGMPPGAPGTAGAAPGVGAAGPAGGVAAGAGAPGVAGLTGNTGGGGGVPTMLGDMSPFVTSRVVSRQTPGIPRLAQTQIPGFPQPPEIPPPFPPDQPPTIPRPEARSLLAPSVRGFKIADNQSPIPLDRVFFSFNYFNDVNRRLNDFFETPIEGIQIYRYVFGFEKTFNEGLGSFGLRLPLNNIYAQARQGVVAADGTSTALGDLTIFGKHILIQNPNTGSLVSVGLALTPPTGPTSFAGADYLTGIRSMSIQPFLGYFMNFGRLFMHGFSAIDVPSTQRDVTMIYNDLGLGYFLYTDDRPGRILTSIVPTVEVHVNTPLTHREAFNIFDPAGTPDVVNITSGVNIGLGRSALMTFGIVTPVTGPRPFNLEAVALLNIFYGQRRGPTGQPVTPFIGG
ncbi:hypothetical protein BH23PLA1_BH23PLA1_40850 [soil metagenome]